MTANCLIFCLSALLFHNISGQCFTNIYNAGLTGGAIMAESILSHNNYAYGTPMAPAGLGGFAPSCGGGFAVTSASPIAPNGVTIISDNLVLEGALSVCGQLPVLGTAALEGPLPAAGQGAVEYGCGDGEVAIISESVTPDGLFYAAPAGLNPNLGYSFVY